MEMKPCDYRIIGSDGVNISLYCSNKNVIRSIVRTCAHYMEHSTSYEAPPNKLKIDNTLVCISCQNEWL